MGTRSFVGMMVGDKIRAIYVHYDGYLEGVGAELQEYNTQEAVEALLAPGDRTSLDGPYYKDRGETDVEPVDYDSFEEFFDECDGAWGEWYYIFKDGVWYCGSTSESNSLYKVLLPYRECVENTCQSL